MNNPIIFIDPSGHFTQEEQEQMLLEQEFQMGLADTGLVPISTSSKDALTENLEGLFVNEFGPVKSGLAPNSGSDALNIILEFHDEDIKNASEKYFVPTEMIEAILYREIRCFNYDDYFDVFKSRIFNDASIGLGQIFIETAQEAEEVIKGIRRSKAETRKSLANPSENINYIAMVIAYKATIINIAGVDTSVDLQNATSGDLIEVFSLYNGYGDSANH